jgi:hypothetical protein
MPYVRRQPPATTDFAWPPTREELDLIQVVEADTLRPVCARCDEPEPARPLPPELLKAVVPVRPVISLVTVADTPPPVPPPAPQGERRPSWMWSSMRFDPSWLLAAGAATAIALSAYLSLRAAPSVSASDISTPLLASTTVESSPPIVHPATSPFAHLELGWTTPMIKLPPPQPQRRQPRRHLSTRDATLIAAVEFSHRSASPAPAPARLETRLQPRVQPASIQGPVSSVSSLNTRRSPFLSTVIASMPTSRSAFMPTASLLDTNRRDHPPATTNTAATTPDAARAARERARTATPTPAATTAALTNAGAPPGAPSQPPVQQQIYAALHEYEQAYEQLDAKAVRAVWPSVDTRALERAFRDLKSQRLVFEQCDIDVARVQATAACRGRATYETRAGQQAARSEPREWTFTLQKSDEAWRIVSATAR